MYFIKDNKIQFLFMLIALGLLAYGYFKELAWLMAISSAMAIAVWFIDAFKNTKKQKKLDKYLTEARNRIAELEDCNEWHIL